MVTHLEKEELQVIALLKKAQQEIATAQTLVKEEIRGNALIEAQRVLNIALRIAYKEEVDLKREEHWMKKLISDIKADIAAAEV